MRVLTLAVKIDQGRLLIWLERDTGSVEVIGSSPILSTIENEEYIRKMIYSFFYSISSSIFYKSGKVVSE